MPILLDECIDPCLPLATPERPKSQNCKLEPQKNLTDSACHDILFVYYIGQEMMTRL